MKAFADLERAERRFLKNSSTRMMTRTRTTAPAMKMITATVPAFGSGVRGIRVDGIVAVRVV